MRFGSVCSGIEAASTAWHPLGWKTAYVADIDPFPCAVLAHRIGAGRPEHMPDPNESGLADKDRKARRAAIKALNGVAWGDRVRNFGDFTKVDASAFPIDLIVGGTPCQAFSVAGERQSLADARGNLTLEYVRLIHATKSLRWAVWENVPGVLSTDDNAFGCFLGGLVGSDDAIAVPSGEGWPCAGMVSGPLGRAAWRILDAQHFGLAQRRRRVFVVFCPAAAGGDPSAVLFERKGLCWDPSPGRETWQGTTGGADAGDANGGGHVELAATLRAAGGGVSGKDCPEGRVVQTFDRQSSGSYGEAPVASTVAARDYKGASDLIAHTLRAEGFDASEDGTGRGTPLVPVEAFDARQSDVCLYGDRAGTLDTDAGTVAVHAHAAVRRLTPRECERLQGFPDDYTLIPWKGRGARQCPDGPRYKALGNSMAVPVMRWIGERIQAFEDGTLADWEFEPAAPQYQARGGVAVPILEAGARTGVSTTDPRAGIGIGADGDPMFTLQAGKQHAVATGE